MATDQHSNSPDNDKGHWFILGAGAIGCLWAASFCRAGFSVTLISSTPRSGNYITFNDGNASVEYPVATLTIDDFLNQDVNPDRLLIATKAHQTLAAIEKISPQISVDTLLLIIQNGLVSKLIADQFPNNTVIAGITTDGAFRTNDMTVVLAGRGKTMIGRYDGRDCTNVLEILPTQQLTIECCPDIELRQWQKLAINCAINGLTAIYQCKNGELLGNTTAMHRMEKICKEIIATTAALGFPQHYFSDIFSLAKQTIKLTGDNYSSMYQDIQHHRKTEIDFINGFVCREASQLHIPCPENQAIVNAVTQLELSER